MLFLCTHNAARSQMAEASLRSIAGTLEEVASAETEPSQVNTRVLRAKQEVGIALTHHTAKPVKPCLRDVGHEVMTVWNRP